MARLPFIEWEDANDEAREFFRELLNRRGRVPNSAKILAHSPKLGRAVVNAIVTIQREGVLERRIKELAIVKTSTLNACRY